MQCSEARLTVESLTTLPQFETLKTEWDELLDESRQRAYFLRHRWNVLWWKYHAPANSQLRVITCRDQRGVMVGAAPPYVRRYRVVGPIAFKELAFLGMGIQLKTSEYLDVIARNGYEERVARAIADHLKVEGGWDRVRLSQVLATSPTLPHFVSAMIGKAGRVTTTVCDRAPYIETNTTWEHYKSTLGRSMRRNVEYYARRLLKTHTCEFSRVGSLDEFDEAFEALVRLHQARWQSEGEPGSFSHPGFEPFMRDVMKETLREGRLRFWTLKVNGTIEAALVGFLDNGRLHYFQKGFNPAFAAHDLGTAMLGLCLRSCFDDPAIDAFDFMGGGAAYKERWAKSDREMVSCEVQRSGARGWLLEAHHRVASAMTTTLRKITPTQLRAFRRDWVKGTAFRRSLKAPVSVLKRAWHVLMIFSADEVPVVLLESVLSVL